MESNFTFVFIIVFFIFIALIYLIFFRSNGYKKPKALKKEELISKYEYEMLQIKAKYESNPELFKEKKLEYLKKASHELHNNIFFDEFEAKELVRKLASY